MCKLKNVNVIGYDKYKISDNTFNDCINADILFLCLPTVFNEEKKSYDMSCIEEVLEEFNTEQHVNDIFTSFDLPEEFLNLF